METRSIVVGDKTYTFFNQTLNTKNGFKHVSELHINLMYVAEASVNYLNRTWESYEYATVMRSIINSMVNERFDKAYENYKTETKRKRLSEDDKGLLRDIERRTKESKELAKVYEALRDSGYSRGELA